MRVAAALLVLASVFVGCSSGSGGGGQTGGAGGGGNFKSCSQDSDCGFGQGCDTEGGSSTDGYCTPLCDNDTQCPTGFDCPSMTQDQPGECDEVGDHNGGRGICDQFDGVNGPNTCGGTGTGGTGGGGVGGSGGGVGGSGGGVGGSGGGVGGSGGGVGGSGGGTGGSGGGPVSTECQSCGISACPEEGNACLADPTCASCVTTDVNGPGCASSTTVQNLLACVCPACTACAPYCGST